MLISLMKEEEIPQVAALEQVCFSEPWTEQGLRESFARPEYLFVTATEDGQVVGYAGLYQVLDEGDITNIAVLPSVREKGIGTVLTRALIEAGEQRAIHALHWRSAWEMRLRSIFMKSWDLSRREFEKDFMKNQKKML